MHILCNKMQRGLCLTLGFKSSKSLQKSVSLFHLDAYEECTEETRMFPNGTATEPPVKPKIRFTFSGGSSTSP